MPRVVRGVVFADIEISRRSCKVDRLYFLEWGLQ